MNDDHVYSIWSHDLVVLRSIDPLDKRRDQDGRDPKWAGRGEKIIATFFSRRVDKNLLQHRLREFILLRSFY